MKQPTLLASEATELVEIFTALPNTKKNITIVKYRDNHEYLHVAQTYIWGMDTEFRTGRETRLTANTLLSSYGWGTLKLRFLKPYVARVRYQTNQYSYVTIYVWEDDCLVVNSMVKSHPMFYVVPSPKKVTQLARNFLSLPKGKK